MSYNQGDTNTQTNILFTYSGCFNDNIINILLDQKGIDFKARNKYGQTLYESFIYFITKIISNDGAFYKYGLNTPITVAGYNRLKGPIKNPWFFNYYLVSAIQNIITKLSTPKTIDYITID